MIKDKVKVLLIEDEQSISQMYKLKLEDEGFEVTVTDRGSEVLGLVKKNKFSIILLDVILPEVDGFSILQSLKSSASSKKIPVLLLTNLGQDSDQKRGKELGASGYFIKSSHTPAQIIEEIKKVLKK